MVHILTADKIPKAGLDLLSDHFRFGDNVYNPVGVLIRSTPISMSDIPESVLAISRAGSGINHIPCKELTDKGIVVMNTPGANAVAVAESAITAMLILTRRVYEATDWVASLGDDPDVSDLTESNKTKFKGKELTGQRLGIIGIGATGRALANFANAFNMEVLGYKPNISLEFRTSLPSYIKLTDSIDDIYKASDFISLTAPSKQDTRGMINADTIGKMKPGVFIINFSRADLVDNNAIIDAVNTGNVAGYFTDFPSSELQSIDGILATPHIGGRTQQASDNCAIMAVQQLIDYLENGSISNSILFPTLKLDHNFSQRICILHKTSKSFHEKFLEAIKKDNINLQCITSENKGEYGYTVIDTDSILDIDCSLSIQTIPEVLRVRILQARS